MKPMTRRTFIFSLFSIPFVLKIIHKIDYRLLNLRPRRIITNIASEKLALNTTASFIIERCDGNRTLSEITRDYISTFEVDFVTAINDTANAIMYFYDIGWVDFK